MTSGTLEILHVLPTVDDSYGGPPRVVAALLPLSARLGMRARVVASVTSRGDVARQIAATGDLQLFAPGLILGRLYGSIAMLRAIWTGVGRADLVLAHSLFTLPAVFSGVACRLRGTPWILAPHSCLDPYDVRQHYRLKAQLAPLWRVLLRRADLWCATDVEARQAVTFGTRPRAHVVPPPVEPIARVPEEEALVRLAGLDLRPALDTGGCIVSFVGRFDVKKGIPGLVDCFDLVAGDNDVLVLAGRGDADYERIVDHRLERSPRRRQIRRPGWLSDEQKAALWSLPGFFALPSDNENFGVAVAEAMAAGVPVVITDRVGLADLVETTSAGIVTRSDTGDTVGFAAAMTAYLSDPDRRRRDGGHGRTAVQQSLSEAACLDAFRQMLDTALAEQRPGRTRRRTPLRGAA